MVKVALSKDDVFENELAAVAKKRLQEAAFFEKLLNIIFVWLKVVEKVVVRIFRESKITHRGIDHQLPNWDGGLQYVTHVVELGAKLDFFLKNFDPESIPQNFPSFLFRFFSLFCSFAEVLFYNAPAGNGDAINLDL